MAMPRLRAAPVGGAFFGPCALIVVLLLGAPLAPAADAYAGPYRAEPVRVVDGDTLVMRVRLWPGIEYAGPVRLAGVDAPELRARLACERRAARQARDYVAARIAQARALTLRDVTLDKYGRALARVYVDGDDLAARLIAAGHGRAYAGGKRGAWCQ